jgi:predicted  nucleic acid-binding Zn-ribbon protein
MAELTDPPSGKPLVLRVEISAENGGSLSVPALEAGLRALAPAVAPVSAPAPDEELERRKAELERREARLEETERRLNERELELEAGSGHTASEKIRLASREKRMANIEEELEERLNDVSEREDALQTREVEFEADVELREQRIERWRTELMELEQRLDRKETELTLYVGELQGELAKREPGWWPAPDRPLRHH